MGGQIEGGIVLGAWGQEGGIGQSHEGVRGRVREACQGGGRSEWGERRGPESGGVRQEVVVA